MTTQKHVIIVGGGFAGMSCAHELVKKGVRVTLVDKNNYHKFTPLLYQVATSALSVVNAATTFRHYFWKKATIDIKMTKIISADPKSLTVYGEEGESYQGDFLVLACGSTVNFFGTKGAEEYAFPLYTLAQAIKLRSRIVSAFEEADRNPKLIDEGILNFVIVGAGPTGTELAGALADMLDEAMPKEFSDLVQNVGAIHLVDGHTVLRAFSEESQNYAKEVLQKRGVKLHLGLLVKEVASDYVLLSDGNKILTKTVVWAGGLEPEPLSSKCGLFQGHGGRIDVLSDLTVQGYENIYVLGDFANIKDQDGKFLPQLASVAQQSGQACAKNILASIQGRPRSPFEYNDKGIMAMIGMNAAVAEIGTKRRKLSGHFAFLLWLLVHAALLPTLRQKISALWDWMWDYFGSPGTLQIIDRNEEIK